MATRCRKIARSAVRRVKRRESKRNAKHQTSKKRMNSRKMKGGKDKNDFYSIYAVKVNDTANSNKVLDIGILFYNHKTKKFHLFIQTIDGLNYTDYAIKLIKGLCGFGVVIDYTNCLEYTPNFYSRFKYYFRFDGKKLYSARYEPKENGRYEYQGNKGYAGHEWVNGTDEKLEKREIKPNPPDAPTTVTFLNQETQTVTFSETTFTFVKIVNDNTEESKYQPDEGLLVREKSEIESALQKADKAINERDTKNKLAAAAAAEEAAKKAKESPICNELQRRLDSAKKAIEEIQNIRDFFVDRGTVTAENVEATWKETKTPEELAKINELIGEFKQTIALMRNNRELCWTYLENIDSNKKVFDNIILNSHYDNSEALFKEILYQNTQDINAADKPID